MKTEKLLARVAVLYHYAALNSLYVRSNTRSQDRSSRLASHQKREARRTLRRYGREVVRCELAIV